MKELIVLISIQLAIFITVVWGYVLNIINLLGYDALVLTGPLALQIAGMFIPPIGALMGFLI